MNCPFYGRHAVLRGPAFPIMIAQQGNQRAVITTAYSPCRMEIDGQEPDWRTCRCWRLMSSRRSGGRDDLGHGCRAQRYPEPRSPVCRHARLPADCTYGTFFTISANSRSVKALIVIRVDVALRGYGKGEPQRQPRR